MPNKMTCCLDWVDLLSPSAYHVQVLQKAAEELQIIDFIYFSPG